MRELKTNMDYEKAKDTDPASQLISPVEEAGWFFKCRLSGLWFNDK
jgi:hypothetical protein